MDKYYFVSDKINCCKLKKPVCNLKNNIPFPEGQITSYWLLHNKLKVGKEENVMHLYLGKKLIANNYVFPYSGWVTVSANRIQ